MNTDEQLFRAYGIAASLLRSDLRDGTIDMRCQANHYSPQDTREVKEALEQIAGDLTANMYVHLRQIRKITKGKQMTLDELLALKEQTQEPVTVTHCGSTGKCKKRFQEMRLKDTIAGKMVLTIGADTKSDTDLAAMGTTIDKVGLDILHLWKIGKSQEVLILDITDEGDHYFGESTRRELEYARRMGKRIRFYSEEVS